MSNDQAEGLRVEVLKAAVEKRRRELVKEYPPTSGPYLEQLVAKVKTLEWVLEQLKS